VATVNGPIGVIFRQEHPPGRMGLSDFTEVADLGVTIAGQLLDCRLYHSSAVLRLLSTPMSCSRRKFVARRKGCRTPCGRWAGPRAAPKRQPLGRFRNLGADAKEDLTTRYEASRHTA